LRIVTPSSIVPYIVMPLDPPDEDDDDPAIPEHPAHSSKAATSAATKTLDMIFPCNGMNTRIVILAPRLARTRIDVSAARETSDAGSV
jgi:hypothetical protein